MNLKKILPVVLVALVISISGCVEVTVTQKLRRNGASDFNISVESDSKMVVNALENQFEKKGLALSNAKLSEKENGFVYSFENIKPRNNFKPGLSNVSEGESKWEVERSSDFLNNYITIKFHNRINESKFETDSQQTEWQKQMQEGIEVNYDLIVFGKITETNGQKLSDKKVRFDLTEDEDYYVTFKDSKIIGFFSSLFTEDACSPEWDCTDWSGCSNFTKTRECAVSNDCENYMYKPPEEKGCQNFAVESTEYSESTFHVDFKRGGFGQLKLVNSTGHTVGSTYVNKGDMSAEIYLFDFEGGDYKLILESEGEKVYSKDLSFEGSKISISSIDVDFQYDSYWDSYTANYVKAEISNEGDLPATVSVTYQIGGSEGHISYYEEIPTGEKTVRDENSYISLGAGSYQFSVFVERDDEVLDQRSKRINIGL